MSKKKKNFFRISGDVIEINEKKCIGCSACSITCTKSTNISVLKLSEVGRKVAEPKRGSFSNTGCIYCGQCTLQCPTGAIDAREDISKVQDALAENKYTILTFTPATKVTLGEEFSFPIGSNVSGLLVASARKLGFKKVFESDFGVDMTVIEESTELRKRIEEGKNLPMFTSFCPPWVRWIGLFNRSLIPNLSTCKSPQQIMGATIKTYFAEMNNINPKDIMVVSVRPCTAKKVEDTLGEIEKDGYEDIDIVLTVREYAELLKQNGIDLVTLENQEADKVMGDYEDGSETSSGSGNFAYNLGIKGATTIDYNSFNDFEGFNGVKHGVFNIGSKELKVAVVSGIANVRRFLESDKWRNFELIEVRACPGGCVNGGGTPKIEKKANINIDFCIGCGTCIKNCPVGAIESVVGGFAKPNIEKCIGCTLCSNICRSNAIKIDFYDKSTKELLEENYITIRDRGLNPIDNNPKPRMAVQNPEIQNMYKNYLGEIGGEKARKLLHRSYQQN